MSNHIPIIDTRSIAESLLSPCGISIFTVIDIDNAILRNDVSPVDLAVEIANQVMIILYERYHLYAPVDVYSFISEKAVVVSNSVTVMINTVNPRGAFEALGPVLLLIVYVSREFLFGAVSLSIKALSPIGWINPDIGYTQWYRDVKEYIYTRQAIVPAADI